MLKYELLEEFLSIGGNYRPDKIEAIQPKLKDYAENNRDDIQIRDALIILKTFDVENKYGDFEICCHLAIPIFERLSRTDEWDFYDIRILTYIIDYAETFKQAHYFATKLLDKLESYSQEKQYKSVKLGILTNMTFRLLREKLSKRNEQQLSEESAEMFSEYANLALEMCDETNVIHRAIVLVRKGIFYRDVILATKGFDLLNENDEHEIYKLLRDEAREFKFNIHLNRDGKKQFDVLIGENIRNIRTKHSMTVSDLAEILSIPQGPMSMIEAGDRSASGYNIFKLATALNEPVEDFFYGTEVMLTDSDRKKALIEKLNILIKTFSEDKIEYIVDMIKGLDKLKFGKLI